MRDHPYMQLYRDVAPILTVVFLVMFLFASCDKAELKDQVYDLEQEVDRQYSAGIREGESRAAAREDDYSPSELDLAYGEGFADGLSYAEEEYGHPEDPDFLLNDQALEEAYDDGYSDAYYDLTGKDYRPHEDSQEITWQAEPKSQKYVDPRSDDYKDMFKKP